MAKTIPRSSQFKPGDLLLKVIRIANHAIGGVPHGHEFEELVVITGGRGVHLVNGRRYEIKRGDVFVVMGNSEHAYPEGQALALINVLFDPNALQVPLHDLRAATGYVALFQVEPRARGRREFKSRLHLDPAAMRELLGLIGEMEGELASTLPGHRCAAVNLWMRIQIFLARLYGETVEQAPASEGGLSRVIGYMERHLAEPLTVEQLAKVSGMSVPVFFREFGSVMGCPPIEYFLRMRIGRARRLLQTGMMRINEVGAAVGFEDSNYFTRQFRRLTGSSPRDYRLQFALPTQKRQVQRKAAPGRTAQRRS